MSQVGWLVSQKNRWEVFLAERKVFAVFYLSDNLDRVRCWGTY